MLPQFAVVYNILAEMPLFSVTASHAPLIATSFKYSKAAKSFEKNGVF
jgi:hypothetical protein